MIKVKHNYQWRIQDFLERGANSRGGRQPIIWPIFPENCMKMKIFWVPGGARSSCPLDPPMTIDNCKQCVEL